MPIYYHKSFQNSLRNFRGQERRAIHSHIMNILFDGPQNALTYGSRLHRVEQAQDDNIWSMRITGDLRLIVHRSDNELTLLYVGHHDDAYEWARKRRIKLHPRTGVPQLLEIDSMSAVPQVHGSHVSERQAQHKIIENKQAEHAYMSVTRDDLLAIGVPVERIEFAESICSDDQLLAFAEAMPADVGEALIDVTLGNRPIAEIIQKRSSNPSLAGPEARRSFAAITDRQDLIKALTYPWDEWMTFLNPDQEELVKGDYSDAVRVSGSAGTGKSVVALHRIAWLARNGANRLLLTSPSRSSCSTLERGIEKLLCSDVLAADRIDVIALPDLAARLAAGHLPRLRVVEPNVMMNNLQESYKQIEGIKQSWEFVCQEWHQVVDEMQVSKWDEYRVIERNGRGTRLTQDGRAQLWPIFDRALKFLKDNKLATENGMYRALALELKPEMKTTIQLFGPTEHSLTYKSLNIGHGPMGIFDSIVVDECQDATLGQMALLGALAGGRTNGLFCVGDDAQRSETRAFAWSRAGIEIVGRSYRLRVNYRTSHQINRRCLRVMTLGKPSQFAEGSILGADVSVFNGPEPEVVVCDSEEAEAARVAQWIAACGARGIDLQEIAIIVRSGREVPRAMRALCEAKTPGKIISEQAGVARGEITVLLMSEAKGLEFRAVAVVACDRGVIPSADRLCKAGDEVDSLAFEEMERNLFYVGCTRAREVLLVTGVSPPSRFLESLL